ncbi:lipase maturation factor 2-like [Osmerus eperlanus]|uniref:lipase maturation factor 2-like n=1 Tax=Osmerus eperlanus TaxID=29151 RepID=UPI002E15602A
MRVFGFSPEFIAMVGMLYGDIESVLKVNARTLTDGGGGCTLHTIPHLGDTFLESMLRQHGLKDRSPPRRVPEAPLAQAVRWVRSQVRGVSAPLLLWSLFACSATICLLRGLRHSCATTHKHKPTATNSDHTDTIHDGNSSLEEEEEHQEEEKEDEGKELKDDTVEEENGERKKK